MKNRAFLKATVIFLSAVLFMGAFDAGGAFDLLAKEREDGGAAGYNAVIPIAENTYLVRAGHESDVTAEGAEIKTYDLSVTSFNVGGFAAGIDSGIHTSATGYNPTDAIGRWKALLDYDNDYQNHYFTSDIYALQEFSDLFYHDDETGDTGEKLMSAEVFGNVFGQLETYHGLFNGLYSAYSALAVSEFSPYTFTDISGAQLSGKYTGNSRAYIKGYINVKGVDVAVFCVHLGWSDESYDITADSYAELVKLMNNEEYCIVMGDTNSETIAGYMAAAGYKAANMSDWGDIDTFLHRTQYIDNIFVSPNIDIEFVECKAAKDDFYRAYSDHRPLTAYLTVNTQAEGISVTEPEIGADGYTVEYR